MITLYQGPALWGLPNLSPFCIKVETYLRMVELPYRSRVASPRRGPKGKIPWIEDDGAVVADSGFIIEHLRRKHGDPLDGGLSRRQRAVGHTLRRTLEESLYWVGLYSRWIDEASWPTMRAAMARFVPPVIGPVVLELLRKQLRRDLHGQGYGRHRRDECYAIGRADLDAVSAVLQDQPFLLGEQPTSIDAAGYAFVASMLRAPFDTPLSRHGQGITNLQAYCDRMQQRYFPS